MRTEYRYIIVPINTELTEDIFLHYTSNDKTQKIVRYWVTIVDQPYTRQYIDAVTAEQRETILQPGIYGRPSIAENNTEYNETEIQQIMITDEWKPMTSSYTP